MHQWINYYQEKKEKTPSYEIYVKNRKEILFMEIPPYFKININQVDIKSLINLSVPLFLAERWVKYLEKGGKFRKVEDVKKLYGMSLNLYSHLSSHLYVNPSYKKSNIFEREQKYKARCKILDINEADSTDWESLYGIGPYLAQRIITFRQSLCGFVSISQVKETYGLRDSVFQSILPCLTITKIATPCLSVNYSTQEVMSKHPYIRYKLAKAIYLYRQNNGLYLNLEQLKTLPGINDSIYLKIKPYLTLETI
jgi:DNA uptake protein ComE-like DNA-binding protein